MPTDQDIANARLHQEIADRQRAEHADAFRLCYAAFGPGWRPQGRHYLVTHDEADRARKTGGRMQAAATVFTAERSGVRRHFTAVDGVPLECSSPAEAFGALLDEPDPVRGFTNAAGQFQHVHRHSTYWVGYEPDYEPKSAMQLAVARERRQKRAVEREAGGNLFADQIRAEGPRRQPRSREP